MNRLLILIASVLILTSNTSILAQVKEKQELFLPTKESLSTFKIPEWIKDAKLGFWSFMGPQSVPARGDAYSRFMYTPNESERSNVEYKYHVKTYGHPSEFGYKDIIKLWKAEKFDAQYADMLMKRFKNAGADFFATMAHHHDNFDLWDSKYHRWNAVDKGPHKNIVKIWEDATRQNGLRFGLTSHLARSPGWFEATKNADAEGEYAGVPYDGNDPDYVDLYHPKDWKSKEYNWEYKWYQRVNDVLEQHNPDFSYFDGGIPYKDSYGFKLVADYYNKGLNKNNKTEHFILSKSLNDVDFSIFDTEHSYTTKPLPRTWFDDTFIGHWYWNSEFEDGDIPYCSSNYQIDHLIDVVSKNGVVMMCIPQRADGTVHDKIIKVLDEMGDWMNVNGEGIKATRPFRIYGEGPSVLSPEKQAEMEAGKFQDHREQIFRAHKDYDIGFDSRHFRFTQSKDGKQVYVFMLGWPEKGNEIRLSSLGLYQFTIDKLELLGSNETIKWEQGDSFLTIQLPDKAPFNQAVCFKLSVH
jgi:alpha-L-fucosidase